MYTKGSQDFRTQLLKIKKFNPSWLYLPGYDTEVGYIIKQAKELGINANFLSVEGVNSQTLLNITGDLANGLIYSTAILDPDKSDATIQDIFARYQKKYGEEVNFYAGEAYDAIVLFAGVVKDGAKDTQVIRDRMAAVKNFKGISGVITFDEQRHTVKKFGYFIIKNGQFVPYEE
jgi:branched-chain amino acid transport system substrate-binding protein